ncbi:MAG TPA: hypothetical protein VN029_12590, partial [Sphingomonas sp.]|nr:hypothetical protein [Sphingomonas sp.]
MVAIFTGAGTGFERGSGSVLGSSGLLGSGTVGRSGEQLFLNAANGNLLISQQDEFLAGRGPDASIGRTYNSLGNQSDDNGDNWRQSTQRAVSLSSGTINSWGSTLTYRGGDGSEITYSWNGSAYVTTDGAGAYDKITWNGSIYSRTDGDSGTVETFESDGATAWYRLKAVTDTSGNGLTYDYSGGKLANAWTSNGERISYTWLGNHIEEISRVFYEDGTWKTQVTTRYGYDAYDRLVSVSVDLTPEDNSTTDNNRYVTQYTYYGTTDRIATISETDGSSVSVVYDASGRVTQLSQTVGGGAAARVTNIEYGVGYTIVTDPLGVQTRFDYASGDRSGDIGTWGSGNLATAAGTIDGSAATRFTVQSTGVWAGISQGYVTAPAGGTVTWIVTLQGVGSSTAQSLGIYSNDAWGLDALSSA